MNFWYLIWKSTSDKVFLIFWHAAYMQGRSKHETMQPFISQVRSN